MLTNFSFSEKQAEEVFKWLVEHKCPFYGRGLASYAGAIGGAITYAFTPTSLGVICKVKCHCDTELDVSDYEDW